MKQNNRITQVEPRWSTFIHAKGAKLGLPVAGNFELTSRCNFRCRMCYIHDQKNADMSAGEWIEIGRAAVKKGMIFLLLTGGEPFLRPDFPKIYEALYKMGLMISINTNGSLITDEMFDFLVKHPPSRMNISLYGCSSETYNRLCGVPMYEQVKNNIIRLKKAGLNIKLNASITPYNVEDIEEIYAFGEEHSMPVQATTYMYPPVRINGGQYGCAPARFTAEEAANYMLRCREQYMTPEQLRTSCSVPMDEDTDCVGSEEGEGMRCRAGRTAFWITWDGRMLPCGMFPDAGYRIKDMGFDAAWTAVKAYTQTIRMPKECTNCSRKERCSACAASVIAETGNASIRPEYICRMTETLYRLTTEKYGKAEEKQNAD